MFAPSHISKLICLLALFVGMACNNKNSGDAAEKDSDQTAHAAKPADGKPADGKPAGTNSAGSTAAQKADAIADDVYPDFRLEMFSPEEKVKLVKLTKAELCPCADANKSLHECLQSREERCDLAMQSMSLMASMVKASYNDTDILDQVAQLVDNAKRQHSFKLDDRPYKGGEKAKVTLVEFADFQCPHCKEASKIMKAMHEKYQDKIRIYYKQFPLGSHENSELAARASIAAHRQGKFWPMHDELFKNQRNLSFSKIMSIAQRIGLNASKFKVDLESPDVRAIVAEDKTDGENSGLTGTPTIFINGHRFLGESSEEALFAAVDAALRTVDKTTPPTTEKK